MNFMKRFKPGIQRNLVGDKVGDSPIKNEELKGDDGDKIPIE